MSVSTCWPLTMRYGMPIEELANCPAPKSACTGAPFSAPMMLAEFASTGDAEISLFQRLSLGNGMNPLRLAPWPTDMWLQLPGCGEPFTWKFTLEDVLAPGLGFFTEMAKEPAADALPVAVSCVDEFTVVDSAVPLIKTCAPATNLLPVTVSAKLPMLVAAGLMPVIAGVGFISVTALVPLAVASAALVAFTVTELGLGNEAGAEYIPFASIVPVAVEPPAVPFTNQFTLLFRVPDTAALKVSESPARMLAVGGVTLTETPAGCGFGLGGGAFWFCTPAAQPAMARGRTSNQKRLASVIYVWVCMCVRGRMKSPGARDSPRNSVARCGCWDN